ncbi:MAG: DMT family transporter [Rhizobiaceae bacterium]|nr:DMT family transporter [Rhizobiaceae bacterium]
MNETTFTKRPAFMWLVRIAPAIFVVLWATGFIGAKYGMRDAEPFTFLAYRFWITGLILLPIVLWLLHKNGIVISQALHSLISGCLIHGLYLGGVFYAIDKGMAAGLSSLIVSLQPFFTVFLAAAFLGEGIGKMKLVFFAFAMIGVGLVLFPQQQIAFASEGITQETLLAVLIATIGISVGSIYQKKFVTSLNLLASTCLQFIGAAFFLTFLSLFFETGEINWTPDLVFAMVWLVFVLSIGAVGLLMFLIRAGSSASVASLFFLVPVVAMFMAWVLFDERLSVIQVIGSLVVVASVGFASRLKT